MKRHSIPNGKMEVNRPVLRLDNNAVVYLVMDPLHKYTVKVHKI